MDHGVAVVICNGMRQKALTNVLEGRRVGTFFTDSKNGGLSIEKMAENGKYQQMLRKYISFFFPVLFVPINL